MQMSCFVQKNTSMIANISRHVHSMTGGRTHNLRIMMQVLVPLTYKRIPLWLPSRICGELVWFVETTDYRSNFAKTILFKNCFCFSKIPFNIYVESPSIFQCLISIPAGHWVRQIDDDLPRRLFCQLYSALWSARQEDLNDPQERYAMARTSCTRL